MNIVMIRPILLAAVAAALPFVTSCAPEASTGSSSSAENPRAFPFGTFSSNVPHAPKLGGYKQVPSRSTAMRDAVIEHPSGRWTYSYDVNDEKSPIRITTSSGKTQRIDAIYYPEEGGADAAGIYAFVKGGETIVVLQGTSDMTYEETHLKFDGDTFVGARKYAIKGGGMGPDAPGVAPKYKVYPPN